MPEDSQNPTTIPPLGLDDPVRLMRQMSHDLRVPLAAINTTGLLFVEGGYGEITPKQRRAIDRINRNGTRMIAILDDLMAYVKAEANQYPIVPHTFSPRSLVEQVISLVTPSATEKGLTISNATTDAVPMMCSGDDVVIRRIVLALLWNAISFTSEGGFHIASDWTPEQRWILSVKDSGHGIPMDSIPHIFEPFWRGEERPQVLSSGSGLGLTMARALTKLLQGTLTLHETSAQGSTFILSIPLSVVTESPRT